MIHIEMHFSQRKSFFVVVAVITSAISNCVHNVLQFVEIQIATYKGNQGSYLRVLYILMGLDSFMLLHAHAGLSISEFL